MALATDFLIMSTDLSTREQWLEAALDAVRPIFVERGYRLPACRVSCGFASSGTRNGHIGQCWSSAVSADGRNQIFISPVLDDPFDVLDTLVHELVHAVDDCRHKHGAEFRKIALAIGLEGPMRSAGAGPRLKQRLLQVAAALGAYPHAKLTLPVVVPTKRRRARARCEKCGFTVPMLKAYLHVGPPICPQDHVPMIPLGDWEGWEAG